MCNLIEDVAETIINPANCHSYRVRVAVKENNNFAQPVPLYVYMDIIKPNLVGDSYFILLTTITFIFKAAYHGFNYPLYRPIEQSFIEPTPARVCSKTCEDVLFEYGEIPSVIPFLFKKKSSAR